MKKQKQPAPNVDTNSKPLLRLDWCTHEAAKYAVEKWHYSKTMPVAKNNIIGVWEKGTYIGCVVFSWGANPNLCKPYGLEMTECIELVRVALNRHTSHVSKVISIAIRMLRKKSPGIRLLVSFADTSEGHNGSIYQAGNWLYSGQTKAKFDYMLNGKKLQRRAYTGKNFGAGAMELPVNAIQVRSPFKHRYLYPLDNAMKAQIEPLRKPYPKRVRSVDSDTSATHAEEGGATPTRTLLSSEGNQ